MGSNVKRSQVSVYAIIGITVLVLTGIFILNSSRQTKDLLKEESFSDMLDKQNIEGYINLCLKETSLKAIEKYGINAEDELKKEVLINIKPCVDKGFKDETAFEKEPSLEVKSEDESVSFDLSYPIKINSVISLKDFSFTYDLASFLLIGTGSIKKGSTLLSTDKKARLVFDEDTSFSVADSSKPKYLSLKVIDRNFEGLKNGVVISSVAYDFQPDGTKFDRPVTLVITVSPEDIKGIDTARLSIAYFDEASKIWIAVDSYFDPVKMEVRGEITHFSKYAVSICASNTAGNYLIPLGFIAKDPFYDLAVGILHLDEPGYWNFDVDSNYQLTPNSIHLLPEYMTEDILNNYEKEPKDTEESEYKITKIYVGDHDSDDQYGIDDYFFYPLKKIYNFNEIKLPMQSEVQNYPELLKKYNIIKASLVGDVLKDQNALTKEEKEECLYECKDLADWKLGFYDEYKWALSDHVKSRNKDGIRDFANINCEFSVGSGRAQFTQFFVSCMDYDIDKEREYKPDLKSLEWIDVKDESLVNEFQKTNEFLATPNTLGFTASTDEFPVKQGDVNSIDNDRIAVLLQNTPYTATGEFAFNIEDDGGACINEMKQSGENAPTVTLITEETDFHSAYACESDVDFERVCVNAVEAKELDSGFNQIYFVCPTVNPADIKKCYEKQRSEKRLKERGFVLGRYEENIGKPILLLPEFETMPDTGRFLSKNRLSSLPDMDYFALTTAGKPSVEEMFDWSCSDVCIWQLNKDVDVNIKPGKLIGGENVVTVNVLNIKDPVLYAKGYIKIQGNGVAGMDECGANLQDRVNYLCGCTTDGTCNTEGMSDRDFETYNCLASIRKQVEEIFSESTQLGHETDLCDINNMITAIDNRYSLETGSSQYPLAGCKYTTGDPRSSEFKGHIIEDIMSPNFGNGGICVGSMKFCRDKLDYETEKGCDCGGEFYSDSKYKYCCRDAASGSKFLENEPLWNTCRGSSARDSCDIDIDGIGSGTETEKVYNGNYKFYRETTKCFVCENGQSREVPRTGTGAQSQVVNNPEFDKNCFTSTTITDACEWETLYGEKVKLTQNDAPVCKAVKAGGIYQVGILSCQTANDNDDVGTKATGGTNPNVEFGINDVCAPLSWDSCPMNKDGTFSCCKYDSPPTCQIVTPRVLPGSCEILDKSDTDSTKVVTLNDNELDFGYLLHYEDNEPKKDEFGCIYCNKGAISIVDSYNCLEDKENEFSNIGLIGSNDCKGAAEADNWGIPFNENLPKCLYLPGAQSGQRIVYGVCKDIDGNHETVEDITTYGEYCPGECTSSDLADCCDANLGCKLARASPGVQCSDSKGDEYINDCSIDKPHCCQDSKLKLPDGNADENYYCFSSKKTNCLDAPAYSPTCPQTPAEIATFARVDGKMCKCGTEVVDYNTGGCENTVDCEYKGQTIENNQYYLDNGVAIVKCTAGNPVPVFEFSAICIDGEFEEDDISNVKSIGERVPESNTDFLICAGNNQWKDYSNYCVDVSQEIALIEKGKASMDNTKICQGENIWRLKDNQPCENEKPQECNSKVCERGKCIPDTAYSNVLCWGTSGDYYYYDGGWSKNYCKSCYQLKDDDSIRTTDIIAKDGSAVRCS